MDIKCAVMKVTLGSFQIQQGPISVMNLISVINLRELGWTCNVSHIFTKNGILKKKVRSKNEINYMAYLLDILRACDSNEAGVFTFQEKNMGKRNVVMIVTNGSFPNNRDQAENIYDKM